MQNHPKTLHQIASGTSDPRVAQARRNYIVKQTQDEFDAKKNEHLTKDENIEFVK